MMPPGTHHIFRVRFTDSISADFGLLPSQTQARQRAIDLMRDAATARVLDDTRDELPAEEVMQLGKADVIPYIGN